MLRWVRQLWTRSDGECKFWFFFAKVYVLIGVLFTHWEECAGALVPCIVAVLACYFLCWLSFIAYATPSEGE